MNKQKNQQPRPKGTRYVPFATNQNKYFDSNKLIEIDNKYYKKLDEYRISLASYMNNTKWFKLFVTLVENNIKYVKIKRLFATDAWEIELKNDCFNCFNRYRFWDCSGLGPFYFKEMEWIDILEIVETLQYVPASASQKIILLENNIKINEIENIINGLGKFEYDKIENGIRIYGYKNI
jgi:hypothetical protein